jgi:predicted ATPase
MRRYILTGTPGAGKTAILRLLEALGYGVVEEAATAVIALEHARGEDEIRHETGFIDKIVALQRWRQERGCPVDGLQFYDRSPVCTLALSRYLGLPVSPALSAELDRIARERVYDTQVFFVRNIGYVERTRARRISFEDSLRFERIHEETYGILGYELAEVPAGPLAARVSGILRKVSTVDSVP